MLTPAYLGGTASGSPVSKKFAKSTKKAKKAAKEITAVL